MKTKNLKGYTLMELALTFSLIGVMVFGCFQLRLHESKELRFVNCTELFLKAAPWIRKAVAFKIDSNAHLYVKVRRIVVGKQKSRWLSICVTAVQKPFNRDCLQVCLPCVASVEWECWRGKKEWKVMHAEKKYKNVRAVKVVLRDSSGEILDQFLFLNYACE